MNYPTHNNDALTGMPTDEALRDAIVTSLSPFFGPGGTYTPPAMLVPAIVAAIRPLLPASAPEPTPGLVEAAKALVAFWDELGYTKQYGPHQRLRAALNALPEDEWEETDERGYDFAVDNRLDRRYEVVWEDDKVSYHYWVKRQPAPALPAEPQGDVLVVDTDGFIWTPESDSEGRFYTCCTANRDGLTWAQLAPRVTAVYTPSSEPQR